jgi:NADH:ubiquinone oxidoreductase subunit 5 (subunit L)/multisubunit Na+/H+ antiporter MnhA subunit
LSASSTHEPLCYPRHVRVWRGVLCAFCASLIGIGLARFAYSPLLSAIVGAHWFQPATAAYLGAANLAGYLVGAGSKAGIVPLHVWLPLAHPAAPSHVSALMSGVMTKVAVYGFVRIVFELAGPADPGSLTRTSPGSANANGAVSASESRNPSEANETPHVKPT